MQIDSPYVVPFEGGIDLENTPTTPPSEAPGKKACRKALEQSVEEMGELQEALYAENRRALLVVFQAMDAAGKDSTIRAATSGVNPAGFQVFSFKAPSKEELDHDFMWRLNRALPERGRIGIFNRSHYEEVLVLRVHPEYLGSQRIELPEDLNELWADRYDTIRDWEEHLARNGTTVVKFFLHVSRFRADLFCDEETGKFDERRLRSEAREGDDGATSIRGARGALRPAGAGHSPKCSPRQSRPFLRPRCR